MKRNIAKLLIIATVIMAYSFSAFINVSETTGNTTEMTIGGPQSENDSPIARE